MKEVQFYKLFNLILRFSSLLSLEYVSMLVSFKIEISTDLFFDVIYVSNMFNQLTIPLMCLEEIIELV